MIYNVSLKWWRMRVLIFGGSFKIQVADIGRLAGIMTQLAPPHCLMISVGQYREPYRPVRSVNSLTNGQKGLVGSSVLASPAWKFRLGMVICFISFYRLGRMLEPMSMAVTFAIALAFSLN